MNHHLEQIVLAGILLLLSSSLLMVGTQEGVDSETSSTFTISETDLSRAEWKMNHFSNPGFEHWVDNYQPSDLYTYRTTEQYTWYAEAPWPVNEGSRSRGFQSRAIDPNHPAEAVMSRSSWPSWNNPTNLTLKFDWYIDSISQPIDYDYFRLNIRLGTPGTAQMYYYFNCEDTIRVNSSSYMYFFIDGPAETWNVFDRNITEDFFGIAGYYPTQFQLFRFELLTKSSDYSRAFLDDLWMVNGTTIFGGSTGNGDFESSAGWYGYSNQEAADISRSSENQEGDWSLNATTRSIGNQSRLSLSYFPDRRLSTLNPDTFSFQWMMNEFDGANEDTFAYVEVSCSNHSESFQVFYILAYGDNTNTFTWEGTRIINVTGFNTTGQWNTFSRSIWSDISSFNLTDYIVVEQIEINIRADGPNSGISILFDDMQFQSAAMDDMGYEDQPAVGEMALSWSASDGPQPEFTVTDTAYTGSKAANLTVIDGNSWNGDSEFGSRPINQFNDTWLDFYWMIDDSSELGEDMMYLELYFDSGDTLGYIFANYSDVPLANGFDEFIILPETNDIGTWHNFQRNLYDDFVTAFEYLPDTELSEIQLYVQADTGGRFSVLFDDVYLYNDPAPELGDIYTTPHVANTDVNVSLQVYDLSSFTVSLYYRIDDGNWNETAMIETNGMFNATIPGQVEGTQVDYYIQAADAFEQISQSVQIGYTIPDDHVPPPNPLPLILGAGAVIGVLAVIIVYMYFIKPKQSAD